MKKFRNVTLVFLTFVGERADDGSRTMVFNAYTSSNSVIGLKELPTKMYGKLDPDAEHKPKKGQRIKCKKIEYNESAYLPRTKADMREFVKVIMADRNVTEKKAKKLISKFKVRWINNVVKA